MQVGRHQFRLIKPKEGYEICSNCSGTGERPPDGVDQMGLPRWGHEMMDNRVDKTCLTCNGSGEVKAEA